VITAALIGVAAGFVSGMFGVGGGILFVPALTLAAGLGQVQAEATSLVAIVPVAAVGAWRQHGYGNVRVRDAAVLGVLSVLGGLAGVALSNVLPERALRIGFALLVLVIAAQLARSALGRKTVES